MWIESGKNHFPNITKKLSTRDLESDVIKYWGSIWGNVVLGRPWGAESFRSRAAAARNSVAASAVPWLFACES